MVLSACEVDDQSGGNNSEIATVGGLENLPQNRSNADSQLPELNVQAASYQIIEEERITPPNQRIRGVLRIQMELGQSDEAIALGSAEAVREAESVHPGATAFVVFSYSTADVDSFADVGRGFASTDGQGLAGDGTGLITADQEGMIQVEVGGETYVFDR
jgi:hypothetical protein